MKDSELFEIGLMENRSPAMFDRRRRILSETLEMISRSGYDDFSIRELAQRASVSSRTIYNAFGSKDHLIALCMRGYFEDYQKHASSLGDPATFDGALNRQIGVAMRNIGIPNYLRAVAAIYFSPSVSGEVQKVLVDIGSSQWADWLRTLRARRQLEAWVDMDRLMVCTSDLQYGELLKWSRGSFPAEELMPRIIEVIMTLLAGATRGEAREQLRQTLRVSRDQTPDWDERCKSVERALAVVHSTQT